MLVFTKIMFLAITEEDLGRFYWWWYLYNYFWMVGKFF